MLKVPVDASADSKERFDQLLRGLLAVKKTELQKIDAALKELEEVTKKRDAGNRSRI